MTVDNICPESLTIGHESHQLCGNTSEVVEVAGDHIYIQKKRKREEWSSKETDGCPLTLSFG
jgi:hypothetical protein